jgi:hypothetical protein
MWRIRSNKWSTIRRSERKYADLAQFKWQKEDIILARDQLSQFGTFYCIFYWSDYIT